jgi:hypothetical protein
VRGGGDVRGDAVVSRSVFVFVVVPAIARQWLRRVKGIGTLAVTRGGIGVSRSCVRDPRNG